MDDSEIPTLRSNLDACLTSLKRVHGERITGGIFIALTDDKRAVTSIAYSGDIDETALIRVMEKVTTALREGNFADVVVTRGQVPS